MYCFFFDIVSLTLVLIVSRIKQLKIPTTNIATLFPSMSLNFGLVKASCDREHSRDLIDRASELVPTRETLVVASLVHILVDLTESDLYKRKFALKPVFQCHKNMPTIGQS
jgi:hypothetical protein